MRLGDRHTTLEEGIEHVLSDSDPNTAYERQSQSTRGDRGLPVPPILTPTNWLPVRVSRTQ